MSRTRSISFFAFFMVLSLGLAAAACVEVPDGVRAQFAGPSPSDRTNFRPGRHGSAPPVEDPSRPMVAATPDAATTSETSETTLSSADSDASAPVVADGGAAQ